MDSRKTIILVSGDSVTFVVDEGIVVASVVIKDIIEDVGEDSPILLPNVNAPELKKVIEFYKSYYLEKNAAKLIKKSSWYRELFNLSLDDLIQLLYAANYLHMKTLLAICCEIVSSHINDRSPEYIRGAFHITDECAPEQNEQLRLEREWAFQKA